MELTLKINHLYSESLNIYGDLGNIFSLKHRAEKRGYKVQIVHSELGEEIEEADIYFIGGGQDKDQVLVFEDLLQKKEFILKEVDKGKIFLLICGGYQLFGKYFVDGEGTLIQGLGILDIETKALDYQVASRCIGNIIVELSEDFVKHWQVDTSFSSYLVGFENHGGQTKILSNDIKPIGKVIRGYGNNSVDKLEGSYFKNIIGSYCHGSMLPKNPHITDALIKRALVNKYGQIDFTDIEFEVEKKAHELIVTSD